MNINELKIAVSDLRQKNDILQGMNYKLCQISKGDTWYIYFYYNENYKIPGLKPKFKRFREKLGLNKIKDLKEREKAAKKACDDINELLKDGFNPFEGNSDTLSLIDGLEWAYEKKKLRWGKKTSHDFRSNLNRFIESAKKLKYNHIPLTSVTNILMREIIEDMVRSKGLGDHAYLKYKRNIGNLFEELISWEKISFNPCNYRITIRKPKPKHKKLLTEEERKRIREYVSKKNPGFFNYLMWLNHTAMRPVELLRLKVGDVDLIRGEIYLRASNTKDKEDRVIVISKVLRPYININGDPDDYVFGIDFVPEKRANHLDRDYATKLWNTLVKKDLKINSNLYWLKDLGLTARRQSGVSPEAIQFMAGHSSYDQSQTYVKLDRPEIRKQIKEFGEDF